MLYHLIVATRYVWHHIKRDILLYFRGVIMVHQYHVYDVHMSITWDNVITPTLNTPTLNTPTVITPTIITPTLNTSTVTDSLCNSGAFSNPNAVRDCPFNYYCYPEFWGKYDGNRRNKLIRESIFIGSTWNNIFFSSFVKKYFVGPCWKALKKKNAALVHAKKTSDSGIKTMPLLSS
jgi:hypothetical protein